MPVIVGRRRAGAGAGARRPPPQRDQAPERARRARAAGRGGGGARASSAPSPASSARWARACAVLADEALRGLHGLVTGAQRARPATCAAWSPAATSRPSWARRPRGRGGRHAARTAARSASSPRSRWATSSSSARATRSRSAPATSTRTGSEQLIWMGSYGIGPARIVAAAIEQFADEQGISWPRSLAPFDVELVDARQGGRGGPRRSPTGSTTSCARPGLDVLYDDRDAQRGREVRRRRAARLPAAADGRQARARGGRGRGAGAARAGEALAAARGRGGGRGGAVARASPDLQRRLLGPRPLRRPAARDAARRAAPPLDDPQRDRLRAARADPGLPGARAATPTTAATPPAVVLFAFIAWTDYLDGIAARVTGQYSRLGALLDPLTDRAAGDLRARSWPGSSSCCRAGRWLVLAAREAFMLLLTQIALRRGIDLNVNMLGRWAVWPVMFALGPRADRRDLGRRRRCSTSASR